MTRLLPLIHPGYGYAPVPIHHSLQSPTARPGHLIAAGLPAETAVGAASWTARAFLGLGGLAEGGLADITVYDTDPRREPAALRHPRLIVLRGRVVGRMP
ncbi:hypothetical protein ACFS5L_26700 [Streptomyces phyllanthi]|uniref:Amidohydrolase family protein n=1 Tax=Streptomyces phyllanthi TaxID=1803180 RepID=A0A5N8W039_9ACTN|nr:hypothetical protein [Streptomyces phyllanthi]MPY40316.1 hypothetical protein [Streptomyces phyllanthi]